MLEMPWFRSRCQRIRCMQMELSRCKLTRTFDRFFLKASLRWFQSSWCFDWVLILTEDLFIMRLKELRLWERPWMGVKEETNPPKFLKSIFKRYAIKTYLKILDLVHIKVSCNRTQERKILIVSTSFKFSLEDRAVCGLHLTFWFRSQSLTKILEISKISAF